jgi:hypothetical protein
MKVSRKYVAEIVIKEPRFKQEEEGKKMTMSMMIVMTMITMTLRRRKLLIRRLKWLYMSHMTGD